MKKILLNFAVVGGGPTGIEFSAELHDLISDDLSQLYPDLMKYVQITVYDVAPQVLSMFDANLGKYAMNAFKREGIAIKTSHHVENLRPGPPQHVKDAGTIHDEHTVYTLQLKELGEVGVGMVVWSTGLMMNPFVERAMGKSQTLHVPHTKSVDYADDGAPTSDWVVQKHPKTGAIVTNDKMQVLLSVPPVTSSSSDAATDASTMTLQDVFAIGDCATQAHASYPATAQVANQEAMWLAKRLNRDDLATQHFTYKDLGVMAYIGNWKAIVQTKGGNISGQTAWFIWRGAYLTKSVSWRNKILIPMYWFINWVFGRDVSRF
ncbi:hypothetical protein EJ05DRAFT_480096 [Pseudovirgaria hyperparasitica]|uniref:Uncharacterized protein n=1 Tax=Pseudovirgaria hyperparasitica TaxID=470096 RepID=A0A6A6VV56_9PEZI|nr:uncharacterized protein EJ05DRAFT_480096 [Pseudovirgaria hyperparasitica]KAF2753604.1 hypothetical protein EJ05DRAFT_480096 [Pseudovirgaria hyperparasitica]